MPKRLAGEANCEKYGKEVTKATLEAGTNPCQQPLTGTVTLREYSVEKILTPVKYLPSHPHMTAGREERGQKSAKIRQHKAKGDPQRSARIACKIMQKDSGPENPQWATTHVTHANTGTPLAALTRGKLGLNKI